MVFGNLCTIELRGVANKQTKAGKSYCVLNVEAEDGTPYALYCPDVKTLPVGLKKGDLVNVVCSLNVYNGNERLIVVGVEKAV